MEKLAALCLHCCPLGELSRGVPPNVGHKKFSNLAKRWLTSGNVTIMSMHQCYHLGRPRQSYPEELIATSKDATVSLPQSLWDITNLSISIIHHNAAYCPRPHYHNEIKLIYNLANKKSQQWYDNNTRTVKCPLSLRVLFGHSRTYQRSPNSSTFVHSTRHICNTCSNHREILSSRPNKMNKLVSNILRRTNSLSMVEPSSPELDHTQLSQVCLTDLLSSAVIMSFQLI